MASKKHLTIRTELPDAYELTRRLGVDKDGDVQERATELVAANLPDFMPRKSGRLAGSVKKAGPNLVKVDAPYARFLFFGLTGDGKPVNYSNGGPHWDRRMVAERGKAIAAELRRYAMGRRRG